MSSNPAIGLEPAISLADYTSESLMVPQLREQDIAGVIQELSRLLHKAGRVPDMLPFYHSALNREFLVSTASPYGMAFPHGRLNGLPRLCFALGRLTQPIEWGVKGSPPVQLIFLMAVPATDATSYLYVVAGLAKLGKQDRLLADLRTAQTPLEMMSVLSQIKLPPHRGMTK